MDNPPLPSNLLDRLGLSLGNHDYDLTRELEDQYRIVLDHGRSLSDRIEAFAFITDSEVGDTPLIRARNLERATGLRQLFLKFEGGNPTGTQKDRIAFAQCADALRRGYPGISLATCGNYGMACALAAHYAGLKCKVFMPASYHSTRTAHMGQLGAEVTLVEGDYEFAVAQAHACAEQEDLYDANPGGVNTPLQLEAYAQIAYEIYDELRDAPRAIAIPVSNGTVLAGVFKGFVSLYRRGKTSRIPYMVAGSAAGMNPIVSAFRAHRATVEDLPPSSIHETAVNEPLINWHAFDGELGLQALYLSQGWASDVADAEMARLASLLQEEEGLRALPAATAGLAALLTPPDPALIRHDRFVAILTSRLS